MDNSRDGDGRAGSPAAPRTPGGQPSVPVACHSTTQAGRGQREQAPFDREASLALDVQQAALDELVVGFGHLRAAYQIAPANRYLPRALTASVAAFGAAVARVVGLPHGTRTMCIAGCRWHSRGR